MSFAQTLHACKPIKYPGIPHLDALPIRLFHAALTNIDEFRCTEKIDGANLIFGFDSAGTFFTSREGKNGKRFYNTNEYELVSSTNTFRAAHEALFQISHAIRAFVADGELIEVEVLGERQPNAIVYGSPKIVFLRIINENSSLSETNRTLRQITNATKDLHPTTTTHRVTTTDGTDLTLSLQSLTWSFVNVPCVNTGIFDLQEYTFLLQQLDTYLNSANLLYPQYTNSEIVELNLTRIPMSDRPMLKQTRANERQYIRNTFVQPVINTLISKLSGMRSSLSDVDISAEEDIGLEGVVFQDPTTQFQFKLVDRRGFSVINQFNFAVRNKVKITSGCRPNFDAVNDFLGKDDGDVFFRFLSDVASQVFHNSNLGKRTRIRAELRKFENVHQLIESVPQYNNLHTIHHTQMLITGALQQLESLLASYMKSRRLLTLAINDTTITYSEAVHQRTLLTFAETRHFLLNVLASTHDCRALFQSLYETYTKPCFFESPHYK